MHNTRVFSLFFTQLYKNKNIKYRFVEIVFHYLTRHLHVQNIVATAFSQTWNSAPILSIRLETKLQK